MDFTLFRFCFFFCHNVPFLLEFNLISLVKVRYFWPEEGVKSKLLDFHSVPGETAAIITNCLVSTLKKNDLTQKIVAYCGDNCNTNFGGVKRKGKNNVFSYLKKD